MLSAAELDWLEARGTVLGVRLPPIGITMGDPAGVGPELCLRALKDSRVLRKCAPVVFGDFGVLRRVAEKCRLPLPASTMPLAEFLSGNGPKKPAVIDCGAIAAESVRPGKVDADCGRAAYRYIQEAVRAAMSGRVRAIATAPINKESLRLAGVQHPGHTEILAEMTGRKRFCMMMASEDMAVSLVTIHVPYRETLKLLTSRRVLDAIELTAEAMKNTGRKSPRIVVCGLNPHASEHGLFGNEERAIIEPAIKKARAKGLRIEGPLPPDTAFLPEKRKTTDAYVAMYHDQGLIPFKMLAFDRGVNVTLGLPITRTSVDHGTAFDIAWKGEASAESMVQAILWADRLSR